MYLTITDPSSTTLHLLLHANNFYSILWFILEILLFIFKFNHLIYPKHAFGLEFTMIFVLCFNDLIRQRFGIRGNLMLQPSLLILFIVYDFICAIGYVFFLIGQSYVQRTELLLSGISLLLILLEFIFSIVILIRNSRAMPILTIEQKLERFNQMQKKFLSSVKTE